MDAARSASPARGLAAMTIPAAAVDGPPSAEHVEVQIQYAPHPQRAVAVVFEILPGLGMHEHRETAAVEHQPRHDRLELIARERDLVHRFRMRPDGLVSPSTEPDRETPVECLPHRGGIGTARLVVVDVGVVAVDFGCVRGHPRFHRRSRLARS